MILSSVADFVRAALSKLKLKKKLIVSRFCKLKHMLLHNHTVLPGLKFKVHDF